MDWYELKNWLELSTGLDRDSLHIYAGVAVQLMVAFLLRRSLASPTPWFFVLATAMFNEYLDYISLPESAFVASIVYDEMFKDLWNTLLLPSLLLLVARFRPNIMTGQSGTPDKFQ